MSFEPPYRNRFRSQTSGQCCDKRGSICRGLITLKQLMNAYIQVNPPQQRKTLYCNLWQNRNEMVHDGNVKLSFASNQLHEEKMSGVYLSLEVRNLPVPSPHTWYPPPAGIFKTKVDEAVFKNSSKCNADLVGVIVRNHLGGFVFGISERFSGVVLPEAVEMNAVVEAAELCLRMVWFGCLVEGDSALNVKALRSLDEDLS